MILLVIFADLFSCKIKFSNYFFGYQSQFLASEIILSLSILLGQERSYSFYLVSFDLGYKYKVGCQDFFPDYKIFGSDESKIYCCNVVSVSKDLKLYIEVRFQYLVKLLYFL